MNALGREQALVSLQQGTYGTEGDKLDWTYYDEAILAAATATHRLFTTPLGTGGKTLDQTNLTIAGQIPQGQNLDIRMIKIMFATAAAKATADVQTYYDLLRTTTVSIKLANKESMGQWTLQELMGVASAYALIPTVAGDNIPLVSPRFHGMFPLNKPITLAALTTFEVTVSHHVAVGAALNGDRLKIGLSGILTRVS